MKRYIPLFLAITLGVSASAQDQSYADCVVKVKSTWGQPCDKCEAYKDGFKRDFSGVYQLELKNSCNETIEVKVATQEKNGVWRTFPIKALMAGESMTAYACTGNGKYMYWARKLNDTEVVIPSDQEILVEYRGR